MGKALIFLVVLCLAWYVLSAVPLPPATLLAVTLACPLGLLLAAWFGRRALDRQATPENAARVTGWVHQAFIILLGSAAITAVRLFRSFPGWVLPIPEALVWVLIALSALLLLASTANLIFSGLGMPVAFLPTRQLASDWFYGWTRNPIVLSALLFLFCLGLWMRSLTMAAWTLLFLTPILTVILRLFEERELEIRFGAEYLEYKARVPMLVPRFLSRIIRN